MGDSEEVENWSGGYGWVNESRFSCFSNGKCFLQDRITTQFFSNTGWKIVKERIYWLSYEKSIKNTNKLYYCMGRCDSFVRSVALATRQQMLVGIFRFNKNCYYLRSIPWLPSTRWYKVVVWWYGPRAIIISRLDATATIDPNISPLREQYSSTIDWCIRVKWRIQSEVLHIYYTSEEVEHGRKRWEGYYFLPQFTWNGELNRIYSNTEVENWNVKEARG